MNLRSPGRQTLPPCLTVLMVLAAPYFCQAAPASIDSAIRTSIDAAKSAKVIQDAVHDAAQGLTSDDPAARSAARNALIEFASAPGASASSQYLDTLAVAVNTELVPLATHDNLLVRLNVAIVAAKLANKVDNASLAPLVLILLNDKQEGVAIWALKAAKDVIPAVLRNPLLVKGDKLVATIIPVVQAHPSSTVVVQEAYQALMLNYLEREKVRLIPDDKWRSMVTVALTELSKLMRMRLAAYQTGVPSDPMIEKDVANFLVHPAVIQALDQKQKAVAVQLVCDLMALAANRSTVVAGQDREQLVQLVKNAARAVQAAVNQVAKKDQQDQFSLLIAPIQQANSLTQNLPGLVAPIVPAIQGLGLGVTPTTLPSTQPAR